MLRRRRKISRTAYDPNRCVYCGEVKQHMSFVLGETGGVAVINGHTVRGSMCGDCFTENAYVNPVQSHADAIDEMRSRAEPDCGV